MPVMPTPERPFFLDIGEISMPFELCNAGDPLRTKGKRRPYTEGSHNLRSNTGQSGTVRHRPGLNRSIRVRLSGGMIRGRFSGLAKNRNTGSSGNATHCSTSTRALIAVEKILRAL